MTIRTLLLGACLAVLAASPAWAQEGFRSPTGNIHCSAIAQELRCDIGQRSYRPPPPRQRNPECEYGNSVGMNVTGPAEVLCITDTVLNPSHRVLPYGSSWQRQGFTCFSEQTGVRCVNRDGRGWELSRARLTIL